ncbi:ATP12 family protein [Marivivens sp. LCG002]|uniref:ATP12 family chaperone protein n=1 Tax=Marivivens sp. LCG002 TaxID=3051171 RepID=UPI0025537696|nr:ATP12 family protein [Marivivens sp. LCG002]WIV51112.1 ATP12 family protein [Marivivens sp. LCG002]
MSGWKAKRFWKETSIAETDGGFQVLLDGRQVKTPAKTLLVVPTRALAEAIAQEWDAQEGEVDPTTMPVTRSANAALDKVAAQRDEVVAMLASYGGTDLLCYRASEPAELLERQQQAWDPLLDWLATNHHVRLAVGSGVMHVAQDAAGQETLHTAVKKFNNFEIAAFHDLVAMSGSLVIALAVAEGRVDVAEGWRLSRIDETWQEEQWGKDEEATELAEKKFKEFTTAARILGLCRNVS